MPILKEAILDHFHSKSPWANKKVGTFRNIEKVFQHFANGASIEAKMVQNGGCSISLDSVDQLEPKLHQVGTFYTYLTSFCVHKKSRDIEKPPFCTILASMEAPFAKS